MKAMEYQTLCLMCWTLGLFFLLLAVFTNTYYHPYMPWWVDQWTGSIRYPYQYWSGILELLGVTALFVGFCLFWESHNMLEEKEVVK